MVDNKYFLKNTKDFFIDNSFEMEKRGNGFRFSPHIHKNANIAKCITTKAGSRMDDNFILYLNSEKENFTFDSNNEEIKGDYMKEDFRIRKLTPKECLRLMGVHDNDIDKMISVGLSDSALYKLAGNSIVINVLNELHINMFKAA